MLYRDTPVSEPFEPVPPPAPAPAAAEPPPHIPRRKRKRWRIAAILLALFLLLVGWLAITAPLSRSLQPIAAPGITLLSAEGTPIARRGAITDQPVDVANLPDHVPQAFLAIEDRRFYDHSGIDPWSILRAAVKNVAAGGVVEGGSTISQQLAKLAFLSSDQTAGRKFQEAIMAVWLEAWLSKDQILSRYMSSAYFGDNVYGLRAAARHYFNSDPDDLTIGQAAMLAGLVKAPSRLAPTSNLSGARERAQLVLNAMVETGALTEREADAVPTIRLKRGPPRNVPTGTYFADWVFPQAREAAEGVYGEQNVRTTLEAKTQRHAVNAIRRAGLGGAQVALVAMRTDGRVVAMVGGKSYKASAFNRATQARRQPGSTFKLFVYLAALRAGMSPESMVEDSPLTIGDWSPKNNSGEYRGRISLREAFTRSSNVAAVRLFQRVGADNVVQAARDLGVTSKLHSEPSLALGTAGVSLIEMAAAYAAIAGGTYPVEPRGLAEVEEGGWFSAIIDRPNRMGRRTRDQMLDLLWHSANAGTGRAAALSVETFGKTGTSQDNRDAIFIGFAGDLVTAVWVGKDDNTPLRGIQGGGLPARIWRDFMAAAVPGAAARPRPAPAAERQQEQPQVDRQGDEMNVVFPIEGTGMEIGVGTDDGSVTISAQPTDPAERPVPEDIPTITIPAPPPPRPQDDEPKAL